MPVNESTMPSASSPVPFRLRVPDSTLDDLRARLDRTRWPDEPPLAPWSTGTSVGYMKTLVEYWRTSFDWRAQEAMLDGFRQFTVRVDGIDLHYIHETGVGRRPMPLLLSHGWPGSVLEFLKILPMLTDPGRFGGDPADAFTVVAPSLPGYGLSFSPGQRRLAVGEMAQVFAVLMRSVLGYERFGAQGGDWGSFVTTILGHRFRENVIGIHLNMLPLRRDMKSGDMQTAEEREYAQSLKRWLRDETGYQWIQGTKPQTLAFAMTDSPVGLAAWMVEKFRSWSDCDGDPEGAISKDEMLANITLYWVTGAIGSSFWPYYARLHAPWPIPAESPVMVPTGYAQFPKEILSPPRSLAERTYADIRTWTPMSKGGHFAALEQPAALAEAIREFFRPLRSGGEAGGVP